MIGVVLAGGASARFGGRPKGLLVLAGCPMAMHAVRMLSGFCTEVFVEAPIGAGYEALGLPLIHAAPEHAGKGPLAGMAAGLARAADGALIAFAPCDMPFLLRGIYDALTAVAASSHGAYAQSPHGEEPLVSVLVPSLRPALLAALEKKDLPRAHRVLDETGALPVFVGDEVAFANINTPDDLARAELHLSRR